MNPSAPSRRPLVIVGAGGHAREVALIASRSTNSFSIVGVVADAVPDLAALHARGLPYLGRLEEAELEDALLVVAIGSSLARREVVSGLVGRRCGGFATVVDPDATVAPDALLGLGTVVFPQAVISTNVEIGDHSCVNSGSVVSHDASLGPYVTVSPGVLLNGAVKVGEGAFFGSGSVALPGVSVGAWATVGAGAVVTEDVGVGSTVTGVPARAWRM